MRISLTVGMLAAAMFTNVAIADEKAEIEKANVAFMDAVKNKSDVKAFYSPTAISLPDHAELNKGPDAIAAYWAEGAKVATEFTLKTSDVKLLGPDALREIGTWVFNTANSKDSGKYLVVWRKIDGEWKIEAETWNSNK